MNHDSIDFSKQLVKGRIAETLFEQMLRDAGGFTILSFGYENVLPELAHRQRDIQAKETMEIIRRAPDFAIINNSTHEVHLVEIKYMMNPTPELIFRAAKRMFDSWKPAYLFLSTPDGFFFDKGSEIVKNNGDIARLNHPWISNDLQEKYRMLLNQFIVPKP